IAAIGYQSGMDAEESLSKAEGLLFGLRHGYVRGDFVHISKVLDQYFEETGEEEEEHAARKVNTGFNALDEKLGKLEPADMIILAARPSAGKTTLALNIALSASLEKKSRVAIFSLEMARLPLVGRLISCQANIDFRHIRLGQISGSEEKRLLDATGILSECPIYIDDTPQIRMMEIRGKSRRLYYEKGIDLIIIDYLQLIMGDGRSENRVQEVSHISRSIKALARELNVPVIAISQLSRAVEWRTSHRPQLSDLRESGSIEQDADIVMFISRDELYIKEEDWQKDHPEEPYPRGIADVIIAKHRNGPTGEVKLRFFPQYSRFENIEALDRSFQF
ncbi:MAG: replicative DNA helicase, partial [Dehalococcoidia bacterium]|nr:replicative DNA helicase [Dehalococcoidia bacterium]